MIKKLLNKWKRYSMEGDAVTHTSISIANDNALFYNIKTVEVNHKSYKENTVLVYKIFIPDYLEIADLLFEFLDSKEKDRANKYFKKKDKVRFIVCRSLLKIILAFQTKSPIEEIKLGVLENKKPYLPSHPLVFFNVSHSEEYGLIVVSNRPVGVDIEFINRNHDFMNSLEYLFNSKEISFIEKAQDKKRSFYGLWTRKEAFVKAIGKGIDDDFLNIPCLDGVHKIDTSIMENTEHWTIQSFEITDNYLGAVAFKEKSSTSLSVLSLPNKFSDLLIILSM